MIDWVILIKKARNQERLKNIEYLKFRLAQRQATFIEVKHIYSKDKLSIKKTIETKKTKKVTFEEFKKIHLKRIVEN